MAQPQFRENGPDLRAVVVLEGPGQGFPISFLIEERQVREDAFSEIDAVGEIFSGGQDQAFGADQSRVEVDDAAAIFAAQVVFEGIGGEFDVHEVVLGRGAFEAQDAARDRRPQFPVVVVGVVEGDGVREKIHRAEGGFEARDEAGPEHLPFGREDGQDQRGRRRRGGDAHGSLLARMVAPLTPAGTTATRSPGRGGSVPGSLAIRHSR